MTDTTSIGPNVIAFVDQRELSVVKQALTAMQDCLALKVEIGLPVLAETRAAIQELEDGIHSLRLALLRSPHADQMVLPGIENLSKDGEQQHTSHRDNVAS
jgi:hypothetical protein